MLKALLLKEQKRAHVQDTPALLFINTRVLWIMTIITIAPELPGAMEVIPFLVNKGIIIVLGTIVICILYCVICKGLL